MGLRGVGAPRTELAGTYLFLQRQVQILPRNTANEVSLRA